MNIAYIRVSSKDQNPGRQLEKIKALGIDERFVFIDKASGRNFVRPEYIAMKRMLREGDILYIDSLDRLGRNYDGVISEWKEITRKINADIIVLDRENLFDSRKFKSMGNIGKLMEDQFLSLLSYLADEERNKIRSRQREGIGQFCVFTRRHQSTPQCCMAYRPLGANLQGEVPDWPPRPGADLPVHPAHPSPR